MQHPLDLVSAKHRQPLFLTFLSLTLILFAVFRVLDQPLRTAIAPNGIVSFELAGTPGNAAHMVLSWSPESQLHAAFGLGIDYLFMPVYALALAFGSLLAAQKHAGWVKSLGALTGYGAFGAAVFDAVENFALFQVLLGAYETGYPTLAAWCASIKFGLLVLGVGVSLALWIWPKRSALSLG
jgi:hypothetical protein